MHYPGYKQITQTGKHFKEKTKIYVDSTPDSASFRSELMEIIEAQYEDPYVLR